jgi:hypothetical protein
MKSLLFKGKLVGDDASKVCVLYDPKDGRVVHVHGVTVIPGGKPVSEAEVEQRAIAHAKALGRVVHGLKSLHVPISAVGHRGTLKVNAQGTGLVRPEPYPHPRELLAQHRKARRGE